MRVGSEPIMVNQGLNVEPCIKELKEREKRAFNIVVFGVEEQLAEMTGAEREREERLGVCEYHHWIYLSKGKLCWSKGKAHG